MSAAAAIAALSQGIGELTAALGQRVDVASLGITDRAGELPLGPPGGPVSPNGACRLFQVADGWMALNLAREEDHDLIPAWLECDAGGEAWDLVAAHAPSRSCADLRARAMLLGLPACVAGEIATVDPEPVRRRGAAWPTGDARPLREALRVVDLSALWAGPLCGAVLAAMGAEVTKVESVRRRDPTRISTPAFHHRLNGAKAELALDLASADGQARLRDMVLACDVVITSCRPRAWASIGLDLDTVMRARPGLTWVAITGYGLRGEWATDARANRVAFGDDAAAAGGLLGRTDEGQPCFLGDALSDPVTGLEAAAGALRALGEGGGVVDAGMAPAARRAARLAGGAAAPQAPAP